VLEEQLPQNPAKEVEGLSLETKLWRLSMIIAAAGKIHSSLTLDEVLDVFLDIAVGEVGAAGGSVFLQAAGDGRLEVRHERLASDMSEAERRLCVDLAVAAANSGEISQRATESRPGVIVTLPLRDESKASIGVLQIYRDEARPLDDSDRLFLTELSRFASLSIRNAKYHEDSLAKAHLDSEISIAREIQVGVLPSEMPDVRGYDVVGLSRPADETSGDSFDLIASETGDLTVLLADATGHGIGPALSVTQVRSMLRLAIRLGAELFDILKNINDQLWDDLGSNRFVTAFIGHLEVDRHRLTYHSAGQAPLILYRAGTREIHRLEATCPPLGVVPMRVVLPPQTIEFEPGDTLALITDGLFEAEDAEGQMFGEKPVVRVISQSGHPPCSDVAREILTGVDMHRGEAPQADDITMVLIRRHG
jgi:phosphoserine phosphatase